MTTQLKLLAGLAAALVVAVVGYNLLPRQSGVGGSSPSPVSTPASTPTPSPAASAPIVDLPDGTLAAGRYRIRPVLDDANLAGLEIVADVPAGWQGYPDVPALISPGATENDGALIGFMAPSTLFSDPCHWDLNGSGDRGQPGDIEVGPTAMDLVEALRANAGYTVNHVEPYIINGLQAYGVDLQLPGNDVLSTCDAPAGDSGPGGDFLVFGGGFWAQGPDNRWQLAIFEVDGSRFVTMLSYFDGTAAADVAAGQAIVESFYIVP